MFDAPPGSDAAARGRLPAADPRAVAGRVAGPVLVRVVDARDVGRARQAQLDALGDGGGRRPASADGDGAGADGAGPRADGETALNGDRRGGAAAAPFWRYAVQDRGGGLLHLIFADGARPLGLGALLELRGCELHRGVLVGTAASVREVAPGRAGVDRARLEAELAELRAAAGAEAGAPAGGRARR